MAERRRQRTAVRVRQGTDAPAGTLPDKETLRRFIEQAEGRVGKTDISRHFGLGPQHRTALKALLRELAGTGDVAPAGHRRFAGATTGSVAVIEITGTDAGGDPIGRPLKWEQGDKPLVQMLPEQRGLPALAPGARVLARLRLTGPGRFEGRTIKRLPAAGGQVVGVFRPGAPGMPGRIVPADRRAKAEWSVAPHEDSGAQADEIVRAEPLPSQGYGLRPARIVERLGKMTEARAVSMLCIALQGIPHVFDPEAEAEAEAAAAPTLAGREDLRALPLITIDGEDARDFDDAVHAEPREGGGFRLTVAIADVAAYVRPGSALDREAAKRGNSVYFPDRVVPMLPEALSNGWCSLKPGEDRGCLFAAIEIDASGRKTGHRFGRGLMRSAARLTYEQVQAAEDTAADGALPPGVREPLYAAFRALLAARTARGTLDLDLPERRVLMTDQGTVAAIEPRPRLDSHRLIEEFMVLANVAAAEELERLHRPCVYRVHAPPSAEKLANLRTVLATFGFSLPQGDTIRAADLDGVLKHVAGRPEALLVNETVLRAQSMAQYDIDNIGHFGLALPRYAHFTSPIRRYADLLVHRALIRGLRLGEDGLPDAAIPELAERAAAVTATERRAALAERDANDRYMAAYMADKVGASFAARISGVTRFGLFVTLAQTGASGIVPVSTLGDDFWVHDETAQALVGRRSNTAYTLGQPVTVRLAEATPLTGGLVFHLQTESSPRRRGRRD